MPSPRDEDLTRLEPIDFVDRIDPPQTREDERKLPTDFVKRVDKDKLTANLALLLILALILGIIAHYAVLLIVLWNGKKELIDPLNRVYESWLPVLSGFVGSAVAFYFRQNTPGTK